MFQADESQQRIIDLGEGRHLVLAPPGCGKTQILTERILCANASGVPYEDMLCLTFTNRAARSMRDRISASLAEQQTTTTHQPTPTNLFVGNVHRFCSHFLFDNAIVPNESAVIDDDDAISIIAKALCEDESYVSANTQRKRQYHTAIQFSALMRQIEHRHPRNLRLHPECISKQEVEALMCICSHEQRQFTPEMMYHIYSHTEDFLEELANAADFRGQRYSYDYAEQQAIRPVLQKMQAAYLYHKYKKENNLLDFEDLLLLSYDALCEDEDRVALDCNAKRQYKRYSWLQVDEVQDLNALQLAIIDLLSTTDDGHCTALYLGDEQQAIFSFMGAKMSTLQLLREKCAGNVYTLSVNHRSPDYLLNVYNTYAKEVLHINPELLPSAAERASSDIRLGNELLILSSSTQDVEYSDVAQQAERLYNQHPNETTAVIVTSNADADIISNRMKLLRLPHFKVSGTDLFSLPSAKMLFSHLAIFSNEHNFIAWSRLLKGLRVYEQEASARDFVRKLMNVSMLPSDLLLYNDSSYVQEFVKTYETCDVVIFDTETTGLDVYQDDILQIAAIKLRKGRVVPGSEFKVFIKTDREIPQMLGDIENPIIEEMKHNTVLRHDEALRKFIDYAKGTVLLGHNADYDYNILRYNLLRYLPEISFEDMFPVYFDSLKLTRMLLPYLHQYKLKHLLEVLNLEGENSHLADADVDATKNVVAYCYEKAKEVIPQQKELMSNRTIKERATVFVRNYQQCYLSVQKRLWESSQVPDSTSLLVDELRSFMNYLDEQGIAIEEIPHLDYALKYIDNDIVDKASECSLKSQITAHSLEITTLKEADLCGSDVMTDRVFVSTVHKAKGLEFDNVIVFDAVDGRYPNFYNQNNPAMIAEDARKFYVAMTRARKCLAISMATVRHDYHNYPHSQQLTRFMSPLMPLFTAKYFDDKTTS